MATLVFTLYLKERGNLTDAGREHSYVLYKRKLVNDTRRKALSSRCLPESQLQQYCHLIYSILNNPQVFVSFLNNATNRCTVKI